MRWRRYGDGVCARRAALDGYAGSGRRRAPTWARIGGLALIGLGMATSPSVAAVKCIGDCRDDGRVDVSELVLGVDIALGTRPVSECESFANGAGQVDIVQLLAGVRNAVTGCPLVQTTTVHLATNDMAYDHVTDTIYASVPSRAGALGNSIVPIDPHTGAVGAPLFVGSEPSAVAISDDGQFLYVGLDGASSVRRVNLVTMTPEIEFTLGSGAFGARSAGVIKVAPGQPHTIAVSLRNRGLSPAFAGVAVFDDGIKRPNEVVTFSGADSITFGETASVLYGQDTEDSGAVFQILSIDQSGVSVAYDSGDYGGPFGEYGGDIVYDHGLIYSSAGPVYDPMRMRLVGTFQARGAVIPDAAAGQVFFLTTNSYDTATIEVFDQEKFLPLAALDMPRLTPPDLLHSFIRWGDNGLAFAQSARFALPDASDVVFLVETKLDAVAQ